MSVLEAGTRVEVEVTEGEWQRGVVRHERDVGTMVAVQLDGEGSRWDFWHAERVRTVPAVRS